MAIIIGVEAQPDQGSFKRAADQIDGVFETAGKKAGESFGKNFSSTATKEVRTASNAYQKAYDAIADSADKARTAETQLEQQREKAKSLAAELQSAEKRLSDARDTNDTKAAAAAEKDLERVREQQARTNTQITRTSAQLNQNRRAEARATNEAVAAYRNLQDAQRSAMSATSRGPGAFSGVLSQSNGIVGQFSSIGKGAGTAFVAGAAAAIAVGGLLELGKKAATLVVDGFKSVMDTGIDFSKTVNNFQGVTQSSAAQTQQMSAAARALGSDTTLAGASASDAAKAMTELAKAGFTVDQSIGAARGTMELATAAQIDAAQAAEIQANAMNAFSLGADQAGRVADIFANVANASSADMPDLALALQQVGGIAYGFGENLEDTVAALGMFSNAGIKGSDAGTLLKTTLQSITDQSNPAQAAIEALGLSLYNFDTGQFVGFREMFRQLDEAKARMSPQAFQAYTNILFGSDAMRSAMLGSAKDFDVMIDATNRVGTASQMAKAQMQGWPGVMEGISNAGEALKLSLYDVFNTPAGQELGNKLVAGLDGLVDWVNTHKSEIMGFVSGFVSAMGLGADAFLMYTARMLDAGALMVGNLSKMFGMFIENIGSFTAGIGGVVKMLPGMGDLGKKLEEAGRNAYNTGKQFTNFGPGLEAAADGIDSMRDGLRNLTDGFTSSMQDAQMAEEQNQAWAASFNEVSNGIEQIPGTKDFVIKDNSEEVKKKLQDLGFSVNQLPDGRQVIRIEYRDAAGNPLSPSAVNQMLGFNSQNFATAGDAQRARRGQSYSTPADVPSGPAAPPAGATPPGGGFSMPSTGGSSEKLPDAPVLPIEYTSTAGMTAEMASAQNRVDETRHSVAEKEARLNQLLASNVADENDIQKARNDLEKAKQDAHEAEQRLYEQQQRAAEKQAKGLDGMTTRLGEIGAQIDSDFGISKGLAGIAENITKFIANLAAAPLLGQLSAIAEANPSKGGFGLMGIMGAQGAFGPEYTGIDYSKYGYGGSSAMGPYPFGGQMGGGYPGDAALLANVPAGRYTQDQRGDLTQGLADCSSAVEDLVNLMDGQPTGGASMYTGNAAEWLTQRGFLPGMGGPGDFRVGFNSSHMQATLPGGTPFNWGSDAAAARRGIGGSGADDPAFTSHYYRPAGGGYTSGTGYTGTPAVASPSGIYSPANTNPALNNPPAPGAGTGPAPGPVAAPMGGGALPSMGVGAPQSAPFASTRYGGVEPYAGSGGGGVGITQGGMVDSAIGMAASGLDLMAPGAGQAAQTGIKLVNRAIEYGGQVAAIGAQGLMETFLPSGGSELANNGWLPRILGGIAGAAPALPNVAGMKEPPKPEGNGVDPNTTQHGQGGNTTNITVNNQRATEDGTGRDIAYHQQNQNSGPGM
ncbi:tail length tape measure protein [Mycobacterium phage Cornie]|uniref:Tape measure protein n=1 Tax=Mycobacterium phage Cornie TaxID=2704043 RepID=A0A6G6XJW6_9CAUD|nr:tail length tape measure protein [Mycobacterium phage Cornie]QIG58392.1 tape measure protein [Mycobacterium phage Cornie]